MQWLMILGFIETAYRPVKNGKIQDEVVFLDAFEEARYYIAQADAADEDANKLMKIKFLRACKVTLLYVDPKQVNYIDFSPKQLVSVAAALIPFLEHDDASRALMGANMQRQAVPFIKPQAPIVGTGMELKYVSVHLVLLLLQNVLVLWNMFLLIKLLLAA